MAEVISIPVRVETKPSSSPNAFHGSYSQSLLLVDSPRMRPVPEPSIKIECSNRIPIFSYSSDSWYRQMLRADYWNSPSHTPAVQLDTKCDEEEEHRGVLLSQDEVGYYKQGVDMVPPASPCAGDSHTVSVAPDSTSTNDSRPDSPVLTEPIEHAKDDTVMQDQPSRYVDYLSHNWKEEDIWSSWKHIVSKRKAYGNSVRLENASWRTWTKSQYRLKTVPPETLNWLKDSDVTWLYGPLYGTSDKASMTSTSLAGIGISKLKSSYNKKPILKKPSVLEVMLRLSLSASSLPNPAAAAVQARRGNTTLLPQKPDTTSMGRAASAYVASLFSSRLLRQNDGNKFPSVSSPGEQSPVSNEKKHIHFNNKVEQWRAVDIVDSDDDEDRIESYAIDNNDDDSSSDDGFLMMKESSKPKVPNRSNQSTPQTSSSAESSTIAILPSTTLKYQEDTPKLTEPTARQGGGELSVSPSEENLRLSELSTKILLDNYDENAEVSWQPSRAFANHKDNISATYDTLQLNPSCELNGGEVQGDPLHTLFGQVVDAVNTAKDIAYVIWNVGW